MDGRRLARRLLAAAGCVLLTAGAAGAQGWNGLKLAPEDSLGLAPDAEPLAHRRLAGMGRCGVTGHVVVADTGDLRRLRAYPPCAAAPLPPLPGRTLVGVSVFGDCHSRYRLDAFRSESRREFRVRLQRVYGGCRAGTSADAWLELPSLPPGWTVAVSDESLDADVDALGPEWTHIRAREGES